VTIVSTETYWEHDPGQRLEAALLAYLECREKGEELDLREWLLGDPEARAALHELAEDDQALEPWFAPLRNVTEAARAGGQVGDYELARRCGTGSMWWDGCVVVVALAWVTCAIVRGSETTRCMPFR
jgi:hypothetical protein